MVTRKNRVPRSRKMLQAADSGDYEKQLKAVRDLISRQLDSGTVMPRDMASLTKRYLDVCKELNDLQAEKQKTDPALAALHIPMQAVESDKQ